MLVPTPMQVVVVSQTCAVAWRSPEGTYTGNECGRNLDQTQFERWYATWSNPKNPKKQLVVFTAKATTDAVVVTINLYDPERST
jgi:hypothetical protein